MNKRGILGSERENVGGSGGEFLEIPGDTHTHILSKKENKEVI